MGASKPDIQSEVRGDAIRSVLASVAERIRTGEAVCSDAIVAAHPDLEPELGEELRRLERIKAAQKAANGVAQDSCESGFASLASVDSVSPSHVTELANVDFDEVEDAERPGVEIPGYEVLRELHRGGQGVVYQAVQKGTKRKVAIKVLLEGPFASKSNRKRFEREIEIVGQLRHPNIVAVFHSDETRDGRQFCVMDYVRGKPLTSYVREHKPSLEETLHLMATVCDAVQHAHRKGVIHRDLKPSNILVDVDGHPRVLDFGLAKLILPSQETIVSVTGRAVGTLPFMSPEQVRGNPDEVDTRTDVYSLGVILYQALTGADPYPLNGSMTETARQILESDPVPPARSWTVESGVQARSRTDLAHARCPIDDELATIVLKALAKERARRYQSAGELAGDIRAYLAGDAIQAKKDSAWYVLKKAVHRNRGPVASLGAIGVLLLGSSILLSIAYRNTENERLKSETTFTFVRDVFRDFLPIQGNVNTNAISLTMVLDKATDRLHAAHFFPRYEAGLRAFLADGYRAVGDIEEAGLQLKRALELYKNDSTERKEVIAPILEDMAQLEYLRASDFAKAEQLYQESVQLRGGAVTFASEIQHAGRLSESGAIEAASRIFETAFAQSSSTGPVTSEYVGVVFDRAYVNAANGDLETTEGWYRWSLDRYYDLGEKGVVVGHTANALGMNLLFQGYPDFAASFLEQGEAIRRRLLPPGHFSIADSLRSRAYLYHVRGELGEAERVLHEALKMQEAFFKEPAHAAKAYTLLMLASVLADAGRISEADKYQREATDMYNAVGANLTYVPWVCYFDRGRMHRHAGKLDSAESLLNEAIMRFREIRGEENAHVAMALNELGLLKRDQGDFHEARRLCTEALEMRKKVLGEDNPTVATSLLDLGSVVSAAGDNASAEHFLREAVSRRERIQPNVAWITARASTRLALSLMAQHRPADAEPLISHSIEELQKALGNDDPRTQECRSLRDRLD